MNDNEFKVLGIEVEPKRRLRILNEQKLDEIHQATLAVLEEAGVFFPAEKALQIFADARGDVDFDTQVVKIQSDLLIDALDKAPRSYTLASQTREEFDLKLDRSKTFFYTDGCGITTVDLKIRKRRSSTRSDVEMMALIADYLSCIGFYWPIVSAQDLSSPAIPLHELEASIGNTEKHLQTESVMGEKPAQYMVEIATYLLMIKRL